MASDNPPKIIYLDYAATTPLDPEVLEKMMPYFQPTYANASSLHASGRRANQAISQARVDVALALNASYSDEIIFTGSGTESDNIALIGVARANKKHGKHIVISAIEHKAVMESVKVLAAEGFRVTILPVDQGGRVNISQCLDVITPETILISIMYANNEIGTIEPIKEISQAVAHWRKTSQNAFPLIHTDACQAAGYLSLDVQDLGVDLMTLNGSKIYGPKGVGILYKKRGVEMQPLIVGGEQEMNMRAGTESVPLIVGCAEALKKVQSERETEWRRLTEIRNYGISLLKQKIPGVIINGHRTERLPNNIHITIPHIEGESILLMLDQAGIEVSTGSACSAADLQPSHVLSAIGLDEEIIHGSIRFSLGKYTVKQDIDDMVDTLVPIVTRLTHMSALTTHI